MGPTAGGRGAFPIRQYVCVRGGVELKLFSDASSSWGGGESQGSTSLVTGVHLVRSSDGLGSSAKRIGEVGSFSVALGEGQGGSESADFVICENSGSGPRSVAAPPPCRVVGKQQTADVPIQRFAKTDSGGIWLTGRRLPGPGLQQQFSNLLVL